MNAEKNWRPKHIEIEPNFNVFVLGFRGGRPIRDLMPDLSKLPPNADYLFPFGKFRDGTFFPEGAIKSIIVGPKCALSQSDVTSAMQKSGFENFEVITSACQIR